MALTKTKTLSYLRRPIERWNRCQNKLSVGLITLTTITVGKPRNKLNESKQNKSLT